MTNMNETNNTEDPVPAASGFDERLARVIGRTVLEEYVSAHSSPRSAPPGHKTEMDHMSFDLWTSLSQEKILSVTGNNPNDRLDQRVKMVCDLLLKSMERGASLTSEVGTITKQCNEWYNKARNQEQSIRSWISAAGEEANNARMLREALQRICSELQRVILVTNIEDSSLKTAVRNALHVLSSAQGLRPSPPLPNPQNPNPTICGGDPIGHCGNPPPDLAAVPKWTGETKFIP